MIYAFKQQICLNPFCYSNLTKIDQVEALHFHYLKLLHINLLLIYMIIEGNQWCLNLLVM